MTYIKPRPRIGISSCLLGENVRYDGTNKLNAYITEQLATLFEFVPFCPEVAVGMGIPRPPIQLVDCDGEIHALGIADPSMDMSQALRDYAYQISHDLAGLSAYIFKRNSPSCGISEVKVLNHNKYELRGQGIYAQEIRRNFPDLPVIDEQQLADEKRREQFFQQVKKYSPAVNR